MARNKYDGVIEAVRYAADGKIAMVRMYLKRWVAFSDAVLVNREDLVKQLQEGKVIVTGQRQEYVGNQFTIGKQVHLSGNSSPVVTTKDQPGSSDVLTNVPAF